MAQGAQLVGARSVIFMHGGVSDRRVSAIEAFGAEVVRVVGSYDFSVAEATRVAQGYTALVREAPAAMARLARPAPGDAPIVAGECGAVGLAGLLHAAAKPELRRSIGLDEGSRVLLINTEGATDPELYESLVGATPGEVLANHADR